MELRGEAARWSGEDGKANLGGEVGQRGGAAMMERLILVARWGCEVGAEARELQGMVAKSLLQAKPIHGQLRAHPQAISARTCARAPVDAGADGIDNNLSTPLKKLVDALVEISKIGNH